MSTTLEDVVNETTLTILRERFSVATVDRVDAVFDAEWGEDGVFDIAVDLGSNTVPTSREALDVIGLVRDALVERDIAAVPVLYYSTPEDRKPSRGARR